MNDIHWLTEDLKSIRNMVDISLLIIKERHYWLLPTVLEGMFELNQKILDKNCIRK